MLIEQRVKGFLDVEFAEDEIGVFLEIPKPLPATFVVFQLIERGKENQIDACTLEFRSYAPSKYEAAVLDEKVREAMERLNETTDISARLGGGNDNPDTNFKRYRYRCYYNLFY